MSDYELDDDSVEAWRAWVPDLVEKIEDGTLDVDLMTLLGAILRRVNDERTLKDILKAAITKAKSLGFVGGKGDKEAAPSQEYGALFREVVYGDPGQPVIPSTTISVGVIRTGSASYRKHLFDNVVFRAKVPKGDSRWFLDGVLVRVISCGHKNIQIRFPTDPTPAHPNSYQLRAMWDSQQQNAELTHALPIEFIRHALQGQ